MSLRALTTVASAIAVLGATAPTPSLAVTGTYTVTACNTAPGNVNHTWTATDNDTANVAQGVACPALPGGGTLQQQEQGLYTVDNLTARSGAMPGASAGYDSNAPANTVITEFSWDRYMGISSDASWSVGLSIDGALQPSDTCTADFGNGFECSVGGEYGQLSSHEDLQNLHAHQLAVGLQCRSGGCTSGSSIHRVWTSIYDTALTLSDSTPPTIGPFTGSLASGGTQTGTRNLSFPVSDSTGIKELAVALDGQTLPGSPGAQSCDYTNLTPCRSLAPQSYTVNTTILADGQHTIEVKAINAAGLVTTESLPVGVSNHPTVATPGLPGHPPPNPGQSSRGELTTSARKDAQTRLRITRAQVIGHCLILTARLPPDYAGLMTFTVAARHGRHLFRTRRTVKITHGVGHLVLVLNAFQRSAHKLSLMVYYSGDRAHSAQTGTATVRAVHARARRHP